MNVFNLPRLAKASVKTWLKPSYEFTKFVNLCIWACGSEELRPGIMLLQKRIGNLIKKGGLSFTYFYLKEVLRLTVRFLAGQGEPRSFQSGRVMVSSDQFGLPTILPFSLRIVLHSYTARFLIGPVTEQASKHGITPGLRSVKIQRNVVCILTILSVFRIFNVFPKVSLKTILDPFSGSGLTLPSSELSRALLNLPLSVPQMKSPKLLVLETASPNACKSTWGASLDAAAFLFYPKVGIRLFIYNLFHNFNGSYWNAWILCIVLVAAPVMTFIFILGGIQELFIGKLGVVKDQAGKSRIVGITNYWIQVALKPLHNLILSVLERIPMDGTFNQEAPLKRLIELAPSGTIFHSFDLSAATDRLPIDVQAQILDILFPRLGTHWKELLNSIWWAYRGKDYKYAVGQPMGAYSSWAMLALTHHVLVQVAALRAGKFRFTMYAVLGDDIVISDDAVASEYLAIMQYLGVSINLSKSVESPRFLEFAKRWMGPDGVQITPIGPGLLLRLIRNKFYLAALFAEMFKLGLLTTFQELLATTNSLPVEYKAQKWNVLWATFGLNSFLNGSGLVDANAITWCFAERGTNPSFMRYNIWNALLQDKLDFTRKALITLDENILFFVRNFYKVQVSRTWPNRMLEFCLKGISPGMWAYLWEFISQRLDLDAALASKPGSGSWSNIHDLAKTNKAINVSSIDWRKKDEVKESVERAKMIVANYERSRDELSLDDQGHFY